MSELSRKEVVWWMCKNCSKEFSTYQSPFWLLPEKPCPVCNRLNAEEVKDAGVSNNPVGH